MALRVYNTLTRQKEDFQTIQPGKVGMYLCGPTVYKPSHVGHMVGPVIFDTVKRFLNYLGYQVTFVVNITDVDDKLIVRARELGTTVKDLAEQMTKDYLECLRRLNVTGIDQMPRATEHVPEMIDLIGRLIDKGHAYPAAGDVYFDISTDEDYGKLCNRDPEQLEAGSRIEVSTKKRNPGDFALWKAAKPGEPQWPSPWGPGRPGWHIECSAMCRRYLGAEFDIHGGGLDLVFPHHENELAQSRAAGLGFARFWVHNALLNLGATKMSKSLGNVIDLDGLAALGTRAVEVRYYLAAAHYRSMMDFSEAALREAAAGYQRIEGFVQRAGERVAGVELPAVELPAEFVEAMDDDLNTSRAMAVVHEAVRDGNAVLAGDGTGEVAGILARVRAMLDVLGLDPLAPQWTDGRRQDLRSTVDALVALALQQRALARERRDWVAADGVRDELKQAGVIVEDTPHGPRWSVEDGR
jgi:cysteinyl-tRNA synthetase